MTDNQFFRNNNSLKNAWCPAYLSHQMDLLQESDIVSMALNSMPVGGGRTDEERQAQLDGEWREEC